MVCHQAVRDLTVTRRVSRAHSALRGSGVVLVGLVAALFVACDTAAPPPVSSTLDSTIAAVELSDRIAAGDAPLILDVRTDAEFEAGHIPGAIQIPHDQVKDRIGELPTDTSVEIVVHCQSGRRAEMAEAELIAAGYTNVRSLDGHWAGWSAAGLPSE
jgi:phage shock protein E